jgi:ankyrin repeat protein
MHQGITQVDKNQIYERLCVWRSGEGINTTNDKGETYLHFAAFKAQPQLVKWLIEKGADCNMQVALIVRP